MSNYDDILSDTTIVNKKGSWYFRNNNTIFLRHSFDEIVDIAKECKEEQRKKIIEKLIEHSNKLGW